MIFLNRRRTIISTDGPIVKDPSKYWYVEKYVYGELKETVEIPLKTSSKFGMIESGYNDDTFCGWSGSSTSTTISFNKNSSYSNTNTTVKKNLDSENTLKIYAVYRYPYTAKSLAYYTSINSFTNTLAFLGSGTMSVTSNRYNHRELVLSGGITKSDTTSIKSTIIDIYDSAGNKKDRIDDTGDVSVSNGDRVRFYIDTTFESPQDSASGPPSGTFIQNSNITLIIKCDVYMQNLSKLVYRVKSHTPTAI